MNFIQTNLAGVILIEPKIFQDERGFFLETFRESEFIKAGITSTYVQINHSRSTRGTLRGLHYQLQQPQAKLVRVATGKVFDVVVDVRKSSPTYGHYVSAILDDDKMQMLYVPSGFAHGFVVLSETADFIYHCTDYYHPESEQGINWNDPDISIDWPITDININERDSNYPTLASQDPEKLPEV